MPGHPTAPALSCLESALHPGRAEDILRYVLGVKPESATPRDVFQAIALCLRKPLLDGWWNTQARIRSSRAKRVAYLSMEFLIGRLLRSTLSNLGATGRCMPFLESFSMQPEQIFEAEPDPALGNGGLGRLAACFLESLASLGMPATGYGINYKFGLFKQEIVNGAQRERPDEWREGASPWLIERSQPGDQYFIPIYGRVVQGPGNSYNPMWMDWRLIVAAPYDLLIAGYGGATVNALRLFEARSSDEFDMEVFNSGHYIQAVRQKIELETVSSVLYPSDSVLVGKELRLTQEYFLVACALRDITRQMEEENEPMERLPERYAIHMNDTHPSLAVAELMRILVDEHGIPWERAWEITQDTCAFTNHTLLPEALERWPVTLMQKLLPRHLEIIFEINRRFLEDAARRRPADAARLARLSLVEETPERSIRMANLAIAGSRVVNGVSQLHTRLLRESVFREFDEMFPGRIRNKTNGVSHRRWLLEANPPLAKCVSQAIGDGWIADARRLEDFAAYAGDAACQEEVRKAKRAAKESLAAYIRRELAFRPSPEALFDVQVKRIHLYKRQLLNILAVVCEYLQITEDGWQPPAPRVCLFAGKAAPGYWMAKLVIRLIHAVGSVVNNDPRTGDWLCVAFLPDYRVSLAERIIPAADLSEQISTAGFEASGTGNMKLALNGALTIGTLDGANIEIREAVDEQNMFLFGLDAAQVRALQSSYDPWSFYYRSANVRRVIDALRADRFFGGEPGAFRPLIEQLLSPQDAYVHLADLDSYVEARQRAAYLFLHPQEWSRRAILNIAGIARFSSDRTVQEYADDMWGIRPLPPSV